MFFFGLKIYHQATLFRGSVTRGRLYRRLFLRKTLRAAYVGSCATLREWQRSQNLLQAFYVIREIWEEFSENVAKSHTANCDISM
jgi:hypothetical protein